MSAKKRPFDVDQLNAEARDLYDAINHAHPLPCVLISTAVIEQCLATLLHSVLRHGNTTDSLFNHDGGVLGDLSSRAKLAYCLELIPKGVFANVQKIGEIRNRFAHSHLTLDFDDRDIVKLCNDLSTGYQASVSTRINVDTGAVTEGFDLLENADPRSRFKICAVFTANCLIIDAMSAKANNMKMRKGDAAP